MDSMVSHRCAAGQGQTKARASEFDLRHFLPITLNRLGKIAGGTLELEEIVCVVDQYHRLLWFWKQTFKAASLLREYVIRR